MIVPKMAPVRPRVIAPDTGETFFLEDVVATTAKASRVGTFRLQGPLGSGKTTALCHLAAKLSPSLNVECIDNADTEFVRSRATSKFVVFSSDSRAVIGMERKLATWTNDDFIEYLLVAHPDRVKSTYPRIVNAVDRLLAGGSPELWRCILDEFSEHASLTTVAEALTRASREAIPDGMTSEDVGEFCINALKIHDRGLTPSVLQFTRAFKSAQDRDTLYPLDRLLRHRDVQTIFAAEVLSQQLKRATPITHLIPPTYAIVAEIAKRVDSDQTAIDTLGHQADGLFKSAPLAASILNACECQWRPTNEAAHLAGARLCGANWKGIRLDGAELNRADLSEADLSDSLLQDVRGERVQFPGSNLKRIRVSGSNFRESDLRAANCQRLSSRNVNFAGADLRSADFSHASLRNCCLVEADLRESCFFAADLTGSVLTSAKIEGMDLREARLHKVDLERLPIRLALLDGADFSDARLQYCDLEYVSLNATRFCGADLNGAHLTGSTMVQADFRGANLASAGLGEIDWEGADLRDAIFVGCSFHMGSTRCGLVDSPYPSEGTRTGFYTDDYDDQYFKSPEEIRKANLRGADLRGANIADVDFYLVDVREARYGEDQRRHLRRTGAILESRAC